MKRNTIWIILLFVTGITALPAAAQAGPRVVPISIIASVNDYALSAYPFNAASQIIVNQAQLATIEGAEPSQSCAEGEASHSVWFQTRLSPGTVTLDTAGSSLATEAGTSADTVISLYRVTYYAFTSLDDLVPLACSDNGNDAGIIDAYPIETAGLYVIQVSAAPAVDDLIAPSQFVLTASVDGPPVANDEPSGAKPLKLIGMPAIGYIQDATRSLDEPVDPYAPGYLTNTVWYKFKVNDSRVMIFSNALLNSSPIWFSLFQKSGGEYLIAPGYATNAISGSVGSLTAMLEPGTYYLRIAGFQQPAGIPSAFVNFMVAPIFGPHGYMFSMPETEGAEGAAPWLAGWTVKHATPGPDGDDVVCQDEEPYTCYFRLASSGPGEKTALKSVINFNATKLKKGDLILLGVDLLEGVGVPNFDVKLKLQSANGAKQKLTLKVRDLYTITPAMTVTMPKAMKLSKAVVTVKNRDVVPGNWIGIDMVTPAAMRVGEPGRQVAPLKLPFGGTLSPAWQTGTAAPEGLLPAPPPAN